MKRIFTLISIFLLGITWNVYASTNTIDRNTLENLGVKKDIEVTDRNRSNVMNTPKVDASEKIYDFSDILTDDEEQELKKSIDEFIEKNQMDLVIVTTSFPYSYDKENEEYADDFYDYNDFGIGFQYNSGILLLRNTNPSDPYYHMSTTGNAQLYFSDARVNSVLDGIYNEIHAGNYYNAFYDFINRTDYYISQGYPETADNYYIDEQGTIHLKPATYSIPWAGCIAVSGIITLIIMIILIKKNKMVKKAHQAEEYLNKGSVKITNRKDIFLHSHTTSYTESDSSSSGGGGGGHSSHSGSSGVSHGGGGRHG